MGRIRNILIVAQDGRLQYEALLFAASLRHFPENRHLRLIVAEPQPGALWPDDPRMTRPAIRRELRALGAEIVGLQNCIFGADYPQGNKIEALALLPKGEPFVFFDTDTLITGPIDRLDAGQPTASVEVEPTWPRVPLYGPEYAAIWGALYAHFGLDISPTLDLSFDADEAGRYMYFNAGWFMGPCPHLFGTLMRDYAVALRDNPPELITTQAIYPWLDQIVLPLVIARLGGARPHDALGLDADLSLHYRALPVIYAKGPQRAVDLLETLARSEHLWDIFNQYVSFRRMVFKREGAELREKLDLNWLPRSYGGLQCLIREQGHWVR